MNEQDFQKYLEQFGQLSADQMEKLFGHMRNYMVDHDSELPNFNALAVADLCNQAKIIFVNRHGN